MKITAIISEYNPFHNGHLFQLNKASMDTTPDLKIAIMSGNFTQRGIMACLPKDVRARIAIQMGFDIVIEIPTIFAINNADMFSFGAINLLKNFKDTTISFGSELGDINKLKEIVNLTKTDEYNQQVKIYDRSYPVGVAQINVINNLTGINFSGSNNILALEYIKKADEINKELKLHTVKRVDNYNSNGIIDEYMSSSSIRNLLDKENAKNYMPELSFNEYNKFTPNYENFENFLLSRIFTISKEELEQIFDVNEGLENRIKDTVNSATSYEDFREKIKTKRYTESRINRILLNALLGINKGLVKKENIDYISVIAVKKDKINELGLLNNYTKVITKYSETSKLSKFEKEIFEIDRRANNLYSLINNVDIYENMQIVE